MKKFIPAFIALIVQSSLSYAASDVFTEAATLQDVLKEGRVEELKLRDKTGEILAPWLIEVWLNDEAAREFIGGDAKSFKTLLQSGPVSTFVSRIDDHTFDIFFAIADSEGRMTLGSERLFKSLIVCRVTNQYGSWYLDSNFCFLETEGPFDQD